MKKFLFLMMALSLALTACGQLGLEGQVVAPTKPPTVTVPPVPIATISPTPLPTAPTAQCPTPGEGQALYVSRENGYCFLYPATFSAQPDFLRPTEAVDLNGPGITQGQDRAVVHLGVASNGPADGLDSQRYAQKWLTAYRLDPNVTIQSLTLNGQTAALIDDLPGGMFNQRQAFVVANDFKYQITLSPQPGMIPELAEATQQAWDLMAQSLTLFLPANPRPLARPDEVCPPAGADTKLWVEEAQGFCLLYPADFELNPDFPGEIVGGPVLLDTQDWGQVRTSLTVASYDQPQTDQLVAPEVNIDPNSVRSITVNGWPGIVYEFITGPWQQHTIEIQAMGSRYTLVGPMDAQLLTDGFMDAQQLWDTVISSMVFFEKWR